MRRTSRLRQAITEQSIQALASEFGPGRLFSVPASTANAEHIETVIGIEQTCRLVEEFGGNHCYLPGLADRPRNGGVPIEEVERTLHLSAYQQSRKLQCSVRTIFDKRRQIREKGRKQCGKPNQSKSVGITAS